MKLPSSEERKASCRPISESAALRSWAALIPTQSRSSTLSLSLLETTIQAGLEKGGTKLLGIVVGRGK